MQDITDSHWKWDGWQSCSFWMPDDEFDYALNDKRSDSEHAEFLVCYYFQDPEDFQIARAFLMDGTFHLKENCGREESINFLNNATVTHWMHLHYPFELISEEDER